MAAVLLALTAGCAPPEEDALEPFETEEVGGAPDSAADLSTDPIGPRPIEELSGVLPSQFPRSVPLLTPSSLVDFGEDERGRHILVMVGGTLAGVRERQLGALRQAGFEVSGGGSAYRAGRGEVEVTLDFREERGATEIRIGY
jgi:hypothetical protein